MLDEALRQAQGAESSTVPSNDGLRPDDRERISYIRKQSIEADERQPVECAEAQPLRRGPPEHDDLLPQDQVFGFKARP